MIIPAVHRKLAIRLISGLFAIAALLYGYTWIKRIGEDPGDTGTADTAGWITAVQILDSGTQVVAVKPDGEVVPAPDYKEGASDRDPAWRPNGNQIFFSSDRASTAFNIFRWNVGMGLVEQRSQGSRSQLHPIFSPAEMDAGADTALILTGGFVLELKPREGTTQQVLPPLGREVAQVQGDEGGGAGGQFESAYQRLGNSFRIARWGKGRSVIAAVMRRDEGEILILQNMEENVPPIPVVAGDKVEFDIDRVTGKVVFAVVGFRVPDPALAPKEWIKDGAIRPPFDHLIAAIDPSSKEPQLEMLWFGKGDAEAYLQPRVSPDGRTVMLQKGTYEGGGRIDVSGITMMPNEVGAGGMKVVVIAQPAFDPEWHPNSESIVFCMRNASGRRAIHTFEREGANLTDLTGDKGDFSDPSFSPQSAKQ